MGTKRPEWQTWINPGGAFKFKVGDRVTVTWSTGRVLLGRVMNRHVEAALGKTYLIRDQRRRLQGWVPEYRLTSR